jgi:hypothetical protein
MYSSSSEHFFCNSSISYFLAAFSSKLLVMSFIAYAASNCLVFNSPCCSCAFLDRSSTSLAAS